MSLTSKQIYANLAFKFNKEIHSILFIDFLLTTFLYTITTTFLIRIILPQ